MTKKILLGLWSMITVICLLGMPVMIRAAEAGSVTVELEQPLDEALSNKQITVKLAQIGIFNSQNGQMDLVPSFKGSDISLNNIGTIEEAKSAAESAQAFLEQNKIPSQEQVTDTVGKVQFTDLEPGVYLIFSADTKYDRMVPALVQIPQINSNGAINYDVTVYPKHTKQPQKPVNKPSGSQGSNTGSAVNESLYWVMACVAAGGILLLGLKGSKNR